MGAFLGVLLVVVGGFLYMTVPSDDWREQIEMSVNSNMQRINKVQKTVVDMEENFDHFFVEFDDKLDEKLKTMERKVNANMNRRLDNIDRKMDVIYDNTRREQVQKIDYIQPARRFTNADYRGQGLRVIRTSRNIPKNSWWEDFRASNTLKEFFEKRG